MKSKQTHRKKLDLWLPEVGWGSGNWMKVVKKYKTSVI